MQIDPILVVILSKISRVIAGMSFVMEGILFSYLSFPEIEYLLTFNNSLLSVENSDAIWHKLSH